MQSGASCPTPTSAEFPMPWPEKDTPIILSISDAVWWVSCHSISMQPRLKGGRLCSALHYDAGARYSNAPLPGGSVPSLIFTSVTAAPGFSESRIPAHHPGMRYVSCLLQNVPNAMRVLLSLMFSPLSIHSNSLRQSTTCSRQAGRYGFCNSMSATVCTLSTIASFTVRPCCLPVLAVAGLAEAAKAGMISPGSPAFFSWFSPRTQADIGNALGSHA